MATKISDKKSYLVELKQQVDTFSRYEVTLEKETCWPWLAGEISPQTYHLAALLCNPSQKRASSEDIPDHSLLSDVNGTPF